MMNEKLLVKIEEAIRYLRHVQGWSTHGPADISAEVLADELAEILGPLWAMLKIWEGWTPTPENINALPESLRKYVHDLETNCDPAGMVQENICLKQNCEALQNIIEGEKRTVTREMERSLLFVRHIEKHLKGEPSWWGRQVVCKICGRIIDAIAAFGISIDDKGDVPVINEEGHSNEEKP